MGEISKKRPACEESFPEEVVAERQKGVMIPTREECFRLMGQYGMLDHIINHSIEVTKVALFISTELNKKGQGLDLGLVEAASLLHDLTKTECFKTKEDHAATGAQLLKKIGYERVGEVVAEHIQLSEGKDSLSISEEEVVNYADKRVQHDRIVSLEERFSDLKDRYGKGKWVLGQLERLEKVTLAVENKIFSILEIDPNDLQSLQLERSSSDRSSP
jgi:putative nucleotidyltransferase with HDIG domain